MKSLPLISFTLIAAGVACTTTTPLSAREFLRGDTNDDGSVSISDTYYITNWFFRQRMYPACIATGDADDNGQVNVTDAVMIANSFLRQQPLAAPYPEIGEDPTPDNLSCDSYGDGEPLADAGARLVVLDAVATGGEDLVLSVTLGASSSTAIGGFAGTLAIEGGILGDGILGALPRCTPPIPCEPGRMEDLTGTQDGAFALGVYRTDGGKARFAFIPSLQSETPVTIPPSDEIVPVLRLELCLADGTRAGEYAAVLEDGELIDDETGLAIPVPDEIATVSVLSDLTVAGCRPPEPLPPPPPELSAEFRLAPASAVPGGEARVRMIIQADGDIQGLGFSLDFDEELLTLERIETLYQRTDGAPLGFENLIANNDNLTPGNAGVDEGFALGAMVISFQTRDFDLPAGEDHAVYEFIFHVSEDAPVGTSTTVRFLDGAQAAGAPMVNSLIAYNASYTPETAESFVLVNGRLNIIGEISVFRRGDTNGDGAVDVTDGVGTLNYLFLGGTPPACFDAADADDDGKIDLSDPIYLLNSLFLRGKPIPPPSPEPGSDPTEDGLGCLRREA